MIEESTIMNFLMIVAGVIVVLLVLIVMLINQNKKPVKKKKYKKTSGYYKVDMPNVYGLELPPIIEKMSKNEVSGISKKVYDSFKIFDYRNMDLNELDKKDWHTWQVSFLFKMYKEQQEFFIANQDRVFHPFLIKASSNDMKSFMSGLIKKYQNQVNVAHNKDLLSKEYIWTNKDISILFYFLANYKNY